MIFKIVRIMGGKPAQTIGIDTTDLDPIALRRIGRGYDTALRHLEEQMPLGIDDQNPLDITVLAADMTYCLSRHRAERPFCFHVVIHESSILTIPLAMALSVVIAASGFAPASDDETGARDLQEKAMRLYDLRPCQVTSIGPDREGGSRVVPSDYADYQTTLDTLEIIEPLIAAHILLRSAHGGEGD